jgi:hypothetical protein
VKLRSFKLNFAERRARAVPATDAAGAPFVEVPIDLVGEEGDAALSASEPLRAWFGERASAAGAAVRSISFDLPRGRALATVRAPDDRVEAVRVDEHACPELFDLARALTPTLCNLALRVLARRPTPG